MAKDEIIFTHSGRVYAGQLREKGDTARVPEDVTVEQATQFVRQGFASWGGKEDHAQPEPKPESEETPDAPNDASSKKRKRT